MAGLLCFYASYLDRVKWALHNNHSEMFLTDADSEEVADVLKNLVADADGDNETEKNGTGMLTDSVTFNSWARIFLCTMIQGDRNVYKVGNK